MDQNEIVQRARKTAEIVLREAEESARKIREGADHYAADVLAEMEVRLAGALGAVQKGRSALDRRPAEVAPGKPAAGAPALADAAAKSKRAAFDQESPAEAEAASIKA